jgi:hypothetical protein
VGEASVGYSMYPHAGGVPQRIAEVLPDVRLLYLVRHPIERMRSQYLMRVWNGRERMPIERALLTQPFYVDLSRYAMQIDQFREFFPADRMLVVRSEDLKRDRVGEMARVFRFLDVHPDVAPVSDVGEFNAGEGLRRHTALGRRVRRFPGYSAMAALMPQSVRRAKYKVMTRRVKADLQISDRTRSALEDRLRDDVLRLRAYLGEDFDGWGIA